MNIMKNNRFVYYKITEKDNTKTYHGVFDIINNKVIFNTYETINYFIPYSNLEMLALTSTKAYKICLYKNNGQCVENCLNDYKYDIDGNTCASTPTCDDNKITLFPSGICIDSCDESYYVKKGEQCGLCKDFNPSQNSYKLVNGTECREYDTKTMEYFNGELYLLKCKSGYSLIDNDCIQNGLNCHELCEKNMCTEESIDDNNQHCISCIENYYLENGNCKKTCSERYKIEEKKCIPCEDNYCESFTNNTCNCIKCQNGSFLNISNICNKCDSTCKECIGQSNNCTDCDTNHFLYENKCIECDTNCSEKYSDNCKCKECNKGFYVKDYRCYNCSDNCEKCSSFEKCYNCSDNYFINEEGFCESCPSNCKEKDSDNCNCKSCEDHYYLKVNKCEECSEKCKTCSDGII